MTPSIKKEAMYRIPTKGEIYQTMSHGSCCRCLASIFVIGTPFFLFLDDVTLSNAICVCKVWWAEFYSPDKLNAFFSLFPYAHNSHSLIIKTPRFLLNAKKRQVLWRLVLLGEYENFDYNFFNSIKLATLLSKNFKNKPIECFPFLSKSQILIADRIKRDVERTFPYLSMFKRENNTSWTRGHKNLFLLLFYVACKTRLGYCQGMNFLAGIFLHVFNENEELALRCFLSFIFKPTIGFMFQDSFSLCLKYCCYFDKLLSIYLPKLSAHFLSLNLSCVTYGFQWFITLLSYDMPFDSLLMIWDQIIVSDLRIVFQVLLFRLQRIQKELLDYSFDKCFLKVKALSQETNLTLSDLVSCAQMFQLPENLTWHIEKAWNENNERHSINFLNDPTSLQNYSVQTMLERIKSKKLLTIFDICSHNTYEKNEY